MLIAQRHIKPITRKCVPLALLLNWLVISLDVPLPVWSGKVLSFPFPCQDRVCGCRTAEQCWRSCCCSSNEEKLRWARRQGISPPAFVVVAAKREAARRNVESSVMAGCCDKRAVRPLDKANTPSACEVAVADPMTRFADISKQTAKAADAHAEEESRADVIVLSSVRRCQGSPTTTNLSELISILSPLEAASAPMLPGVWLQQVDLRPAACDLAPTPPPPKIL